MWGSEYFTAEYWTSRFFSATGSGSIVIVDKCNIDQTTLLSDAPTDSAALLSDTIGSTSTLTELIENITYLSNVSTDSTSTLTDVVDSTTELCT